MKIIANGWADGVTFTRDDLKRFIDYISIQDKRLNAVKVYPKYAYSKKRREYMSMISMNVYNIGSNALKVKATFKNGAVLIEYMERRKPIRTEIKNISDFTK